MNLGEMNGEHAAMAADRGEVQTVAFTEDVA